MKNKNFCKKLNESLADEKKAPRDYKKLSKASKKSYVKQIIKGISSQERNHFAKLRKIKRSEC